MKSGKTVRTLLLAMLVATGAGATSYVAMNDAVLYEQAAAIAQVSVLTKGPAPAAGAPAIDYIVVVERLLKGQIAGSTVVVRVAGGVGPDGWGLEVVGAPRFAEGDRAILFLVPRRDGTYGVLHLMLGAFHEFRAGRHHLALRDLQDARALDSEQSTARPRDFERFADWLAAGAPEGADYRVKMAARVLERWQRGFALLRHESRRLRWFEEQIAWHLGKPAPSRSKRWLKEALRAWDPLLSMQLVFAGRSDHSPGLSRFDSLNVLSFGDDDDVIPGRFDCRLGGVAAVGGPWFDPELTAKPAPGAGSAPSIRILGADILINDGAECLLDGLDETPREVLIHELGHTLGLGFACGDSLSGRCDGDTMDSVMRAYLHRDQRVRRPDDRELAGLGDPD